MTRPHAVVAPARDLAGGRFGALVSVRGRVGPGPGHPGGARGGDAPAHLGGLAAPCPRVVGRSLETLFPA